ncbi:hypothetical protein PO422_23300, partial [Escherichia coli]
DRNRSHWSTSKTPSYTKSVSWQHHPTIVLHYLVINMNCQRLRDSGFIYIKTYVFGTLAVYIISIITMIAEDFACSGNGSMIFLICYFSTFSMLMLAPTDSSKQ